MMSLLGIFGVTGLVILVLMTMLWLLSLRLRDASIVDIFWGAGFVISVWIYYMLTPDGYPARKLLLAILVTIWGLRLSIHIGLRNLGKGEDPRYQKWRQEHGHKWPLRSLFQVFLLQGFLMWVIGAPLLAGQYFPEPPRLTWLDSLGAAVWLVGFFFEAAGDWQLTRFKANPANKGKLLTSGVWRYTRHPNYFGDAAQWWGFYLIAVANGGWWTLFSPLIMTLLLRFVSGVALLESSMRSARPGYAEYVATTNAFFPWFPKKRSLTRNHKER
jgi:steroid 5-alpha reductase family enzyme